MDICYKRDGNVLLNQAVFNVLACMNLSQTLYRNTNDVATPLLQSTNLSNRSIHICGGCSRHRLDFDGVLTTNKKISDSYWEGFASKRILYTGCCHDEVSYKQFLKLAGTVPAESLSPEGFGGLRKYKL
ncbi:Uncharacterised protein [Chlamydia trachomatis]|nr:Uncharacterised protein [Chlamydia trachomatis]CRI74193.1 Uncharacterised protein [Chlamydia trachomatis]